MKLIKLTENDTVKTQIGGHEDFRDEELVFKVALPSGHSFKLFVPDYWTSDYDMGLNLVCSGHYH